MNDFFSVVFAWLRRFFWRIRLSSGDKRAELYARQGHSCADCPYAPNCEVHNDPEILEQGPCEDWGRFK